MFFVLALVISLVLTFVVEKIARYFDIVDKPDEGRHLHTKKIPLLGGTAIFLSFWIVTSLLYFFSDFLKEDISGKQLIFLFAGSLLIMLLGFFDDLFKISAKKRFVLSALVVIFVMLGGMNFDGITNPLGGIISLDFWQLNTWWGVILPIADLIVFLWLMGMMYSTKILDGLDGLSTGIVIIGALMIAGIASTNAFWQPDIKLLSLIFAGSCLGFLWFNFYPAKIFLGEGGSMFIGLVLGFLAIVSGGKIATALLVMAIPILDLVRVMYKRKVKGRSILKGDREHIHFKLVDLGLSQSKAVLFLYGIAFLFGISTLVLSSFYKLVALGILFLAMLFFEILIGKKYQM